MTDEKNPAGKNETAMSTTAMLFSNWSNAPKPNGNGRKRNINRPKPNACAPSG